MLGQVTLGAALLFIPLYLLLVRTRLTRLLGLAMCASVILHAGYIIMFTSDVTHWSWYYVLGVINLALGLPILADEVERRIWDPWFQGRQGRQGRKIRFQRLVALGSMALILLGLTRAWIRVGNPDAIYGRNVFALQPRKASERWQVQLAEWLKTHLPPGTRLMVYDWPGTLAYLSDLPILPVDGLISDFRYQQELLAQGVGPYLAEKRVTYWLGPDLEGEVERPGWYHLRNVAGQFTVEIFAPLYRKSAGCFVLQNANRVVRFNEFITHPDMPPLALWRTGAARQ
jgi:hypothetical protein